MVDVEELSYTENEIRSYLPSGWNFNEDTDGIWDPKKKTWAITIHDEVDFDWPLVVSAHEAAEHGRMEALRRAMDRTQRERLGKRTRGLGF